MAPVTIRKRRTQLELLLQSTPGPVNIGIVQPTVVQPPDAVFQGADTATPTSTECLCFPEDPERQHKRCWRNLSFKEAVLRANYAASRTSNAMGQLLHNQLHLKDTPAPKLPAWMKIPYPCRCCYPSRIGLASHQLQGHVDNISPLVYNQPYRVTCKECQPNYMETIAKIWKKDPEALQIFQDHGILPSKGDIKCKTHTDNIMCLNERGGRYLWRCNKRFWIKRLKKKGKYSQCNHTRSHFLGSILAKTRIPPWKVLLFIQEFATEKKFNLEAACRKLELKYKTGAHLKKYLDRVCADVCASQQPIGGVGSTVEIDETVSVKKKKAGKGENNQAREPSNPVWILGGKERYGAGFFALPLIIEKFEEDGSVTVTTDVRSRESLIPKLQQYILPGSIIMSDGWLPYKTLKDYPEHKREDSLFKYKHQTVNHNHEFVRQDNPWIHINGVERFWKDLKEYCKMPGMRRYKIKSYIGRYLVINRRRQNEVRRCTTEKERCMKRKYIAETAFHRMLETIADYEKKMRG